jgi:hypothetical protein
MGFHDKWLELETLLFALLSCVLVRAFKIFIFLKDGLCIPAGPR